MSRAGHRCGVWLQSHALDHFTLLPMASWWLEKEPVSNKAGFWENHHSAPPGSKSAASRAPLFLSSHMLLRTQGGAGGSELGRGWPKGHSWKGRVGLEPRPNQGPFLSSYFIQGKLRQEGSTGLHCPSHQWAQQENYELLEKWIKCIQVLILWQNWGETWCTGYLNPGKTKWEDAKIHEIKTW